MQAKTAPAINYITINLQSFFFDLTGRLFTNGWAEP